MNQTRRRRRLAGAGLCVALAAGLLTVVAEGSQAVAAPAPTATPKAAPGGKLDLAVGKDVRLARTARAHSPGVPEKSREALLGKGYEASGDLAWSTSGDPDGFHVLTADAASGYTWRTVATLSEPGFEVDGWIGNACVTASGRRAVVTYAPRTFTNEEQLFERGGLVAVVDLVSGRVSKLPYRSSLAYFSPSCGAGEQAVLTQGGVEDKGRTRLLTVDAVKARVVSKIEVPGQLTSAVPTAQGIVAADSGAVVRVDAKGNRRVLAPTTGVPFKLAADADGGVVYLERSSTNRVTAQRLRVPAAGAAGRAAVSTPTALATGALTAVDITSGRGGRVFVTGTGTASAGATASPNVTRLAVPVGSQVSTRGGMAITATDKGTSRTAGEAGAAQLVTLTTKALRTGRTLTFTAATADVEPAFPTGPPAGRTASPALGTAAPSASSGTASSRTARSGTARSGSVRPLAAPTGPADLTDRYCSVPRNDPANQAMQPKPRQVEWAVDQAVRGVLNTSASRPAGWKNLGMPAYAPQGLFPRPTLTGSTGYIPAQVMLGVASQESNLWEAARYAVPGVTSNPLIGNYYGLDIYNDTEIDDWDIHWADADCGYGITQLTDGMRLAGKTKPGETALAYQTQRAVALDFATNVAAGVQKLEQKWNQLKSANITLNNGDPAKPENWFYAVWSYNSGYHLPGETGSNGAYGLGWLNNPANPNYPANRTAFLDQGMASDAAHPQDWPYPEKVMGFAAAPPFLIETPDNLVAAFRPAWWNSDADRTAVKPPVTQFCTAANTCDPAQKVQPTAPDVLTEPAGPCLHKDTSGRYDLKCWVHSSSTWKTNCPQNCGNELLRFDPGYAYQDDATSYAPRCDLSGLPSNAQVIDDVPDGTPSVRPNCGRPWTNQGTFTLSYTADSTSQYPGKIDTHQIGGGFGGHFWFTHTRAEALGAKLEAKGTWKSNATRNGLMQIYVALPDHGAQTKYATYQVKTANSVIVTRRLGQKGTGNRWVSLGVFNFNNIPEVTLSSMTPDGDGSQDVAYDALALVPVTGTYKEDSLEAVSLFDEDQNIDVGSPSNWVAGNLKSRQTLYDWATGKTAAILALPTCAAGAPAKTCITSATRTWATNWRTTVLSAGTDLTAHPDGTSVATWIGFANPYTDRPVSVNRPTLFDDKDHYKVRTKATVSYVLGPDGKIVQGTQNVAYEHGTGDTHLGAFIPAMWDAMTSAGITKPVTAFTAKDLNKHDGGWTTVDPTSSKELPGRAYAVSGQAPRITDLAGAATTTDGRCVTAVTNAGGADGYRPELAYPQMTDGMDAWRKQLENSNKVPQAVIDVAKDINGMFFNDGLIPGLSASIFTSAPPIWQELNFRACTDGTIKKIGTAPLFRYSWMPDQYFYRNGKSVDLNGSYRMTSWDPLVKGNFQKLSGAPAPGVDNAYGNCDAGSGQNHNPWDIGATDGADNNPEFGHFCYDPNVAVDPAYSG